MEKDHLSRKLAVILHADVVGSTALVQQNEILAHERIQAAFNRFSETVKEYGGQTREIRGDALVAEFERPSDAVTAGLAFQTEHRYLISSLEDELRPTIRVGIAMGEVVIADNTVTGSGVVLAQRVEQQADPGGLCITAALHESLPKHMPFDLENLGEQSLKGFDDPVRVYRVKLSAGQSIPAPQQGKKRKASPRKPKLLVATIVLTIVLVGGIYYWFQAQVPQEEPASVERMDFPLPDKPSIAVLPFTNMSDDPKQEYFADGMTEDLITDISKVSGLFVIARNSVFTYKDKAVKVRQVAEELGVRYVMEGSVQRAGNQVRINAQLIDATTGGHVWAERYDGLLDDVFSMRDRITISIVKALSVTLIDRERGGHRNDTNSLEAYDAFLRGWAHYQLETPDDLAKAISYIENAIELDPGYGRAHAALAAIYRSIYINGWAEGTGVSYDDALKKLNKHLEEAMKNPTPLAHRIASKQLQYAERWDEALAESERAIALDTNDPEGYVAMNNLMVNLGRPAEGLEYIKTAMRLDPQSDYLARLGTTQFHLERYDEASATFLRATKRNPEYEWSYLLLAATYGHLGRVQEAEPALTAFYDLHPQHCEAHTVIDEDNPYTLADLSEWTIKDEAALERLRQGLRKVGMPEGAAVSPADINYRDLVTMSAGTFDVEGAIEINAAEAKALHDRRTAFVDSRGSGHYGRGHIPGATNLYFHQVWDGLSEVVGPNDEVVFYCGGPDCHLSANSSAQAIALGYTKVYYFAGGFPAWENAGYPIEGS
jgi:TolB-like protein/class 3 adenylate cyclase/rhodanese-related sulfurtransferase